MFFAGEVYGTEGAKVLAGFPADLFAKAAGGNVEAETELALGLKKFEETFVNEIGDFLFAIALAGRTELTELFDDLTVFEVDADECVIVATAFDDGPVHDVVWWRRPEGCTCSSAHRFLPDERAPCNQQGIGSG